MLQKSATVPNRYKLIKYRTIIRYKYLIGTVRTRTDADKNAFSTRNKTHLYFDVQI